MTTLSPTSPRSQQTPMPSLRDVLGKLQLADYHDALVGNGFHNWETVLDITEEDMVALDFKIGHRRTLQREIANFRGIPPGQTLDLEPSSTSESTTLSTSALECLSRQTTLTPPPREKRRYRRHPRPDNNAPKKPKTAYVNFADDLRSSPEIQSLSFVDIAKEVGRRWQSLPAEKKRVWESNAARAMQEYEAQMDEYKGTDNWRKYQSYLAQFRLQQQNSASGKRPGPNRSTSHTKKEQSRASPSASSDSPIPLPCSASPGTEAEACHNALTLAFGELLSRRDEILCQGVTPFDENNLPPESLVRRAMNAFVRGTGSFVYTWEYQHVDEIVDRIYRPQKPVDATTLAECFIVAALGAHYDMECFPDRIRKVLYASGTLFFNEKSANIDYLRTIRLLLSMSFYALLEKRMSARYLIAAALQIARCKHHSTAQSAGRIMSESWKRIFRSLIFMDCWLSYTLGYTSEVTPADVASACNLHQVERVTIDDEIHSQTIKLGLIAAEIAKTVASPELATRENISMLTEKLETWRAKVPMMLQIPTLTSDYPPDLNVYQRRAILMVHIMHLGALILLYRKLLVVSTETQADGAACNYDFSTHDAQKYRRECAMAGQQIAQLLSLINFDGTLTKRCWLIIYWAFTASIVLLFSATTKLLEGQPDHVDGDLTYAKSCMDILEVTRSSEPIADRYLDTLWPLYDHLRDIHHRMVGRAKTSIFSLLQSDPNAFSPSIPISKVEMAPICEKLSLLLTDPFGRKQGNVHSGGQNMGRRLSSDESLAVFWWS